MKVTHRNDRKMNMMGCCHAMCMQNNMEELRVPSYQNS